MGNIEAIGFDMDHTLAMYNRDAFEALAFTKTLEKFIEDGYPEELSTLKYDPNYVIRGLLVDRERGNLLKVDGHKYVKIAFHGHARLSKLERHTLYNHESFKAGNFLSIDTFFSLSEVQLFVEIVEYMSNNPNKITKSYETVYKDLRKFIDASHRDGSIKNVVINNPEKFIDTDKHLPEALIRLLDSGKTLFLLTNSQWDYTDVIMKHLLSGAHPDYPNWQDYFHYNLVGGGKPGFFTGSQPFYEVVTESNLLKIHSGPLIQGAVYHGGNAALFQTLTGIKGDNILYVGDHLYGDIIRSKARFNWRTMICVEELNDELPKLEEVADLTEKILAHAAALESLDESVHMLNKKIKLHEHHALKSEEQGDKNKAKYLNLERDKLVEKLGELTIKKTEVQEKIRKKIDEKESRIHPVWGELMKVGLEKSRFAQQLEEYACLYTSKVSNMRFYSPFKTFVSPFDTMPHDS